MKRVSTIKLSGRVLFADALKIVVVWKGIKGGVVSRYGVEREAIQLFN